MKHHLSYCALALALSLPANAALMLFNFNGPSGGFTTAVTENQMAGTPVLTLQGVDVLPDGQPGVAYTDVSGTTHPSGKAASWGSGINDSGGNSITLHFDATGFQDFSLRYDYRSTSAGCPSAAFQYQVGDTETWIPWGTDTSYTRDAAFHAVSASLTSLTSLNGASSVGFRWVLAAGTGTGTFQLDNLQLTATAVPEPRAYALVVGLGLGVFAGYRHRRRSALEGMEGLD
jgi:hypothetical protein